MGQSFGYSAGDCPVTEQVSDRLIRLPFYNDLTSADQEQVIDTITEFNFQ
jgi:dTDP-4-amino-4,6-dideoxygalactose transaminase